MTQNNRFVAIGTNGKPVVRKGKVAPTVVAILDTQMDLMWDVAETGEMNWADAKKHCAGVRVGGFDDWRLPERNELISLTDLSRFNPSIDIAAFPNCKSSWYWTNTPLASSPSVCAWYVYFDDGYSFYYYQSYECFVRAVRASQ